MSFPGKPDESHLLELIKSADPETQMPPADRPRVSAEEQAVLTRWIAEGLPRDSGFSFAPQAYEPPLESRDALNCHRSLMVDRIPSIGFLMRHILGCQQSRTAVNRIDDAGIPRYVCILISLGCYRLLELLQSFVSDSSTDKREKIVRQLLDDNIAYADHWLTFFNDLLRNDYSGTGFITGGRAQVKHMALRGSREQHAVRSTGPELIAPPTPASQGYIDGIRWRGE